MRRPFKIEDALPADFPGMTSRPPGTPQAKVKHVEASLRAHFANEPRFVPFVMLHEFEALLFTDVGFLVKVAWCEGAEEVLRNVVATFPCPEDIDDGPETAPSKRIKKAIPLYRKTLHGPTAAEQIGLAALRASCPHFDAWLVTLEGVLPRS